MNILELDEVRKSFGGIQAAGGISLGFERGKITGLIGPNGAGKTTLFNIICGFLRPDSGRIVYDGKDIARMAPWLIANLGVGRLFQDVHVFDKLTVLDNVLAAFKAQSGENFLMNYWARGRVLNQERTLRAHAMGFLERVGLAEKAGNLAEDLSFGQQKLLAVARLLAADAKLLLLDEPSAGVSPHMIKMLYDLSLELVREGKTILFIEHNMNVVLELADWVYFLDEGQVVSFGLPSEVLSDSEVKAAYIGI